MEPDQRPTGDQVLARVQNANRPRLRLYIGAAPGMGTYSMPREAHDARRQGSDVVVGFVETYQRTDTEAQVGDLEVVPRRSIEYRGVVLEEIDIDAILKRKPQLCVVDELAHSNVPGSRHEKREGLEPALIPERVMVCLSSAGQAPECSAAYVTRAYSVSHW